jgi:hypothetical protein
MVHYSAPSGITSTSAKRVFLFSAGSLQRQLLAYCVFKRVAADSEESEIYRCIRIGAIRIETPNGESGLYRMGEPKDRSSEKEVLVRINRYLRLRGAERAIAPSQRFLICAATVNSAREVAQVLLEHFKRIRGEDVDPALIISVGGALSSTGESAGKVDFTEIDRVFGEYSARLHGVLDQTSIAQFRATLPWTAEHHRDEVCALLDHCLHDSKTALRRLDLVDYVVTTLSTRVENGMRHVVREPWTSSTRLQAVCSMVEEKVGNELDTVEHRLREVLDELTDLEDVACIVDEVRKIKHSLGKGFFKPSILLRIVEFNALVANHFESLLDAERAMDDDVVRFFRVQ